MLILNTILVAIFFICAIAFVDRRRKRSIKEFEENKQKRRAAQRWQYPPPPHKEK